MVVLASGRPSTWCAVSRTVQPRCRLKARRAKGGSLSRPPIGHLPWLTHIGDADGAPALNRSSSHGVEVVPCRATVKFDEVGLRCTVLEERLMVAAAPGSSSPRPRWCEARGFADTEVKKHAIVGTEGADRFSRPAASISVWASMSVLLLLPPSRG